MFDSCTTSHTVKVWGLADEEKEGKELDGGRGRGREEGRKGGEVMG